jgi:hypothetical protein
MKISLFIAGLSVAGGLGAAAQTRPSAQVLARIREEGFRRSQVMELASQIADVYGPRLAGSPSYRRAAKWAQQKLTELGLANAAVEPWGEYGMGWESNYTAIHLIAPEYQPIIGYPRTGSRGTNGPVRSEVIFIDPDSIRSDTDLDRYRGKLAGRIVFTAPIRPLAPHFTPEATRWSARELDSLARLTRPSRVPNPATPPQPAGRSALGPMPPLTPYQHVLGVRRDRRLQAFFRQEQVGALVYPSDRGDLGTVFVYVQQDRTPSSKTAPPSDPLAIRDGVLPWGAVPSVEIATEQYNRMMRILARGIPVTMEVDLRTTFYDDDLQDYNVIAELPGTDRKDEVVMIGAHFDGRSSGTGGTDDGAGSAAVIEAMRILKAVGARPRRTIRAALWGAEEPGMLGSRGYVLRHFGDPETGKGPWRPEHDKLAAYFNLDEGAGKIRGVFLQGVERARPIFREWLQPFADLGIRTLTIEKTGGSDHESFVAVGLPGFQFIQDNLELDSRTHHSNMDVYDRLVPDDLMTNAVVLASFAYLAAIRDEKLPRPVPEVPDIFRERPFARLPGSR